MINEKCPICGAPLKSVGGLDGNPFSPSVEKIVCERCGYEQKGGVIPPIDPPVVQKEEENKFPYKIDY